MLSMQMWNDIASLSLNVKEIIANLAVLSFKHLYETFAPPQTRSHLLQDLDNSSHSLLMMYLSLLLFEVLEKLKIFRYRESKSLSNVTVLSMSPSKLSLSSLKSLYKVISDFVDVENNANLGMLGEVLLLLIITSQLVCLVPWLLPSLSNIRVLSFLPSKLTLSPGESFDKIISESVNVEDNDSSEVLGELLLLSIITSQSVTVPFSFSRTFLPSFCTLRNFWLGRLKIISPESTINPRNSKSMLALGRIFWYWSENLSVRVLT